VDLLQIEQVMLNLLKNAAEAIHDGGSDSGVITVTAAQKSPDYLLVSVEDTGPGFLSAVIEEGPVFNASKKAEGLGIGLSLCRSIVESHGGEFRISNTGTGASVTFTLPVAGKE
jgi:signal transduction histidine kinase